MGTPVEMRLKDFGKSNIFSNDGDVQDCFETTNKLHFKSPIQIRKRQTRKELLKNFYWNQCAQQVFDDMKNLTDESMANCTTTYDDQFKCDGFSLKDPFESVDSSMFIKYPLYTDPARTIYYEKLDKIKGKAVSAEPQAAFRKCSYFSKPWYAELE